MLPISYELSRDNTNKNELLAFRILLVFNIILKLLSVSLISLTVLFSEYYWILVVGIFLLSMIISKIAYTIAKQYKYTLKNDIFTVYKVTFDNTNKILFSDNINKLRFTKKYTDKTIVTTKENFAAIITNGEKAIMFAPDKYLIGLLEEKMRNK